MWYEEKSSSMWFDHFVPDGSLYNNGGMRWEFRKLIISNGRSEEHASGSERLCGWFSEGIRHEHSGRKHKIEGSRRFEWGSCKKPLSLLRPCHENHDDQGGSHWWVSSLHTSFCELSNTFFFSVFTLCFAAQNRWFNSFDISNFKNTNLSWISKFYGFINLNFKIDLVFTFMKIDFYSWSKF